MTQHQFDESKVNRSGDGKFAAKGPAAEADDVSLAEPTAAQAWVSNATEALRQPDPELDIDEEYYRYMVARATLPGLSEREAEDYAEAMGDPEADHDSIHRWSASTSNARIDQMDDPFRKDLAITQVRESLVYLASEHSPDDSRVPAAVGAICPHLEPQDRERMWAEAEQAGADYNRYKDEPRITLSGMDAAERLDQAIDNLTRDHHIFSRKAVQ